mgnify:FL=1
MHLFDMDMKSDDPAWLEVSLLVNGELAEPVATLLSEHLSEGVVMERVGEGGLIDGQTSSPLVKVYGYIPNDARVQARKQEIKRGLWHLSQIEDLPEPVFRTIEAEDWRTAWQKNYRPIPIGNRLMVVPSWMSAPDQGRETISMSPGMAFGSGTHPTTQLSLLIIEDVLSGERGIPSSMIDIGCGSGILSIAAVKLGLPYVLALDNDPKAVQVTRSNLLENKIQDRVDVHQGSVSEILRGEFNIQKAPLVCANIIASVLQELIREKLTECVDPGGTLILSGMLEGQAPEILALLDDFGFEAISRRQEGDWVALQAGKKR